MRQIIYFIGFYFLFLINWIFCHGKSTGIDVPALTHIYLIQCGARWCCVVIQQIYCNTICFCWSPLWSYLPVHQSSALIEMFSELAVCFNPTVWCEHSPIRLAEWRLVVWCISDLLSLSKSLLQRTNTHAHTAFPAWFYFFLKSGLKCTECTSELF